MAATDPDFIKRREIIFGALHPDPDQAASALALLEGVGGILSVQRTGPHSLEVSYDLRVITLQLIEDALVELGFHLDGSLINRLKRALFHYTEETQRSNLGHHPDVLDIQDVFINSYQQRPHGCRDERPQHWREYL